MKTNSNKSNIAPALATLFLTLFTLAQFEGNAQTIVRTAGTQCVGVNQSFQFTGPGFCFNHTWSVNGGGTIISGQGTGTLTVKWNSTTSSASVSVQYGCAGGSGNKAFPTFTISNPVTPSIGIGSNAASVCSGSPVTFSPSSPVNPGGSPTYTWYVDGASIGTGSTKSYTGAVGGHTAYVRMTSSAVCATPVTVQSNTISFTVTSPSSYTVQLNSPGTMCAKDGNRNFTFHATAAGTYNTLSYQWYKNDAPVATTTTFNTTLVEDDRVYCKVFSTGCVTSPKTTSTLAHYTPSVDPVVSIHINKNSYCDGETMSLTRQGNNGTSYSWKLNLTEFSTTSGSTSRRVSTDNTAPDWTAKSIPATKRQQREQKSLN